MTPWGYRDVYDRKGNYSCKDCQDRKVGCHATCESFLAEKARAEEVAQTIRQKRKKESLLGDYTVERMRRIRNRINHDRANQ